MYWNASGSSVDGGRGRRARNFRRREYLLIVELVVGLIIRRAGGKGGGEVRMMHNNGSEVCKGQGRGGGELKINELSQEEEEDLHTFSHQTEWRREYRRKWSWSDRVVRIETKVHPRRHRVLQKVRNIENVVDALL